MDRRSFILGTGTLALSQLLIGCGANNQTQLKVQLLNGSIPGQVVNKFQKALKSQEQLKFSPVAQIQDLFKQLQTWQQKPKSQDEQGWTRYIPWVKAEKTPVADVVTLGDYWLKAAIEQKLIQPLNTAQIKNWSALDAQWKQLVTRNEQGNPDPQGKVWAVPYRWGSTVMVYNREKFQDLGWTPTDWSDLWRTELRSQISLLNHPREVIGLVLKKLGNSYNTENIDQVANLESELRALNQQVKFYNSTTYLEPLIIEDTWLAVGWSDDIIPLLSRYPHLSVVLPKSGTAIWADLWVRPQGSEKEALANQWMDFCLQSAIAKDISVLSKTNSPIAPNIVATEFPEPLRNLLVNNREVFAKSEFLLPLSSEANKQYETLFNLIKIE
ncbi:extracellular solute-binding protein [Calothrix sp. FACHB-1219]|uniref:extracellular solute-binding protein n=1 Tax=unclassified Calothrix TaxID=2619626 RepID=UPI0016894728|nr:MULTISPECIES: extracellular solute-binding protein [unclassified Calothrix]MBD2205508.1 extracellular solute-binding protein [Calothrix sp. FACHB-168]MBD2220171.1 extracellular solute-binding protein [Calothrix sp. FACHB-1219]